MSGQPGSSLDGRACAGFRQGRAMSFAHTRSLWVCFEERKTAANGTALLYPAESDECRCRAGDGHRVAGQCRRHIPWVCVSWRALVLLVGRIPQLENASASPCLYRVAGWDPRIQPMQYVYIVRGLCVCMMRATSLTQGHKLSAQRCQLRQLPRARHVLRVRAVSLIIRCGVGGGRMES